MKSLVVMRHEKSNVTITVPRAQVKTANYHGWVEVEPENVKVKVKKDGKSNRK